MKVNFKTVVLNDIEGKPVKDAELHKLVGNLLYRDAQDLALVEMAQRIYKGEEVELRDNEVAEIKKVVAAPQAGLAAFAKKALLDALEAK